MTTQNILIVELLSDDTFVNWVKGTENLPEADKERWDQWLEESSGHKKIVQHAKKIMAMPFNVVEISCNSSGELDRFLKFLEKE